MGHHLFARRSASNSRRGLSFVEFVGCLVALSSGLALGSVYLGVDIKTLFVGVMEQADIVEPGYFSGQKQQQQPEDEAEAPKQQVATAQADSNAPTEPHSSKSVGKTQDLQATPDAPREEATSDASLKNLLTGLVEAGQVQNEPPATEAEIVAATHEYWKDLTVCIKQEVRRRTQLPNTESNWQLFDYLSHRAEGHEKAIEAIEALPTRAVDKELLHHGEQVKGWHQAGAKLYRRAVGLLTSSPSDQFSGPSAQSWQSSATQHRMEEKLVRDKHFSISNYLNHTYGASGAYHPAY